MDEDILIEFMEIMRVPPPTRPIFTIPYLERFTLRQMAILREIAAANKQYVLDNRHLGNLLGRWVHEGLLKRVPIRKDVEDYKTRWAITIRGQALIRAWDQWIVTQQACISFPEVECARIRSGVKTQYCWTIPYKSRLENGIIYGHFGKPMYAVGGTYTMLSRTTEFPMGHIRITHIAFVEDVRCLSPLAVKAEGHGSLGDFLRVWTRRHDFSAMRRPEESEREWIQRVLTRDIARYRAYLLSIEVVNG